VSTGEIKVERKRRKMRIRLIDSYLTFRNILRSVNGEISVETISKALTTYFNNYPEISKIVRECLDKNNILNWCSRLLSEFINDVEELDRAWKNTYATLPKALFMFTEKFSKNFYNELYLVLYVSCGCGAGWAFEYHGIPAIYLGLDMIAYLKWLSEAKIKGLIIHELCHLLNMKLQNTTPRKFSSMENDPYFLLYSEGFAMKCEHYVLGGEVWRIASDNNWIAWCRNNLGRLARLYVEYVEKGLPVNVFYGSFYNIDGYSQTGYFLGHEFIKYLENKENMGLIEIAKLRYSDIINYVKKFLSEVSSVSKPSSV